MRSRLKAQLCEEGERTRSGGLLLDERLGVSYPDGDRTGDGTVFITCGSERRGARGIVCASFHKDDVLRGDTDFGPDAPAGNDPQARVTMHGPDSRTEPNRTEPARGRYSPTRSGNRFAQEQS